MRRLTKAAMVIVAAAVAAETFGQVMGFTRFDCGDEITYEYSSVADACASYDVNAYRAPNAGVYECTVCASDPVGPGPGIIPGPRIIIVPPPACPEGQHRTENGGCQADHVCGDDEIGGGSEECEACPAGEVANPEGTACEIACGQVATDRVAKDALLGVPAEAMERGASVYCLNETVHIDSWATSPANNACEVSYSNKYATSCWDNGSKTTGCNLSRAHTHPFFSYPRDSGVRCSVFYVTSQSLAHFLNLLGRDFSKADTNSASNARVMGHLGLPPNHAPPWDPPIPTQRVTVKALRRSGNVDEI